MSRSKRSPCFVIDATVLIDYANTNTSILQIISKYIGAIHVPKPVLREVRQLDIAQCEQLDIHVIDYSVEQAIEAGSKRGRLSFEDHLCLIIARDHGWTCVTNDKPLREACKQENVNSRWGLELLIELVRKHLLEPQKSIQIAEEIHLTNPHCISKAIVIHFQQRIQSLHGRAKK